MRYLKNTAVMFSFYENHSKSFYFSFKGTWLGKIRRWSLAYHPINLIMCNTNNGAEGLNSDLKHEELIGQKSLRCLHYGNGHIIRTFDQEH